MKKKTHMIWVLVVVIALIGGYFWGKASAVPARSAFSNGRSGTLGAGAQRFGGTGVNGQTVSAGQISSMDSSSITLQLPNGNSQVIFYSTSTEVTKPTVVSVSTLSVGSNVAVVGTANSDGSMTASSIQVRPAGALGGVQGAAAVTGSSGGK